MRRLRAGFGFAVGGQEVVEEVCVFNGVMEFGIVELAVFFPFALTPFFVAFAGPMGALLEAGEVAAQAAVEFDFGFDLGRDIAVPAEEE
jgi:hypothetical protein